MTATSTLPSLPPKRRGAFCTKCHNSFTPAGPEEHPVCVRCGYLAFAQDCDYSDDEMRTYGRDAFIAGYEAAQADAKVCQVPPPGWRCTRDAGHDGPCAAVEAPEDVELVERGMARLREQPIADPRCGAWVPVSERLPPESESVLIASWAWGKADTERIYGVAIRNGDEWMNPQDPEVYGTWWPPTHWMPLTAAPATFPCAA